MSVTRMKDDRRPMVRRFEMLERNSTRKQIKSSEALAIIADELEQESQHLHEFDESLQGSAELLAYLSAYIRTHFCDDSEQAFERGVLAKETLVR